MRQFEVPLIIKTDEIRRDWTRSCASHMVKLWLPLCLVKTLALTLVLASVLK